MGPLWVVVGVVAVGAVLGQVMRLMWEARRRAEAEAADLEEFTRLQQLGARGMRRHLESLRKSK